MAIGNGCKIKEDHTVSDETEFTKEIIPPPPRSKCEQVN
jgi:hypothetical protein